MAKAGQEWQKPNGQVEGHHVQPLSNQAEQMPLLPNLGVHTSTFPLKIKSLFVSDSAQASSQNFFGKYLKTQQGTPERERLHGVNSRGPHVPIS